jgi:hypothetical protein
MGSRDAHIHVSLLVIYFTEYNRVLRGMSGSTMEDDQMQRLEALLGNKSSKNRKASLKHARKNKAVPTITHEILLQEVQYVQQKLEVFLELGRRVKKRKLDQVQAQREHTAIDCSCCFDGFPVADMVSCREEGHLFCIDCLKTCVEEQIFGQGNLGIDKRTKKPSHEIQCFHGDGCSSGFDRELLEKALSAKTLAKYDELQFKVSLEAAGLSLVSCPKCAFQVELPVGQKILTCPVLGCGTLVVVCVVVVYFLHICLSALLTIMLFWYLQVLNLVVSVVAQPIFLSGTCCILTT